MDFNPLKSVSGSTLFLAVWAALAGSVTAAPPPSIEPGEVLVRFTKPPKVTPPADKKVGALWQYVAADKQMTGARMPLLDYLAEQGLVGVQPLVHVSTDKSAKTPDALRATSPLHRLVFAPDADVDAIVAKLKQSAGIVWAEPNYRGTLAFTPGDPLFAQQQTELDVIGLRNAWDVQQGADASVRVAVIDSGCDAVHPELSGALDFAASYNFVDDNTTVADDRGHGTRIAGLIGAAASNGEGIAGTAFGCTLLSLDVTDREGSITSANVISALQWAIANDADIANLSLTFRFKSVALEEACNAAVDSGMLLVAAAGNENQGSKPVYPASYDSVLGVGAVLDSGTARAPWSNFNGTETSLVDLVAPGDTMFSTIPGSQYNGTYGSGTSFAAPLVAGTAALLKTAYPDQPGAAIGAHLRATATALDTWAGEGLLNADAALATAFVPEVVVASVTIDDDPAYDAANDGDGIFDAGESVKLVVALSSNKAAVKNVTATLSTVSPHITGLGDASADYALIDHGRASKNEADPFGLVTADAVAPAGNVAFALGLSAPGGFTASLPFTVRLDNLFTAPLIIDTDMTWTNDKTWVIEQGCVVLEGATLTIEPGTTVRFQDRPGRDNRIEVRGGIIAEGAEEGKISFSTTMNRPSGGFQETLIPVSAPPYDIALGDVNADGANDIVVTHYSNHLATVLRWNGMGFGPEQQYTTGTHPAGVAIGDVDNDGDNDVVITNLATHDISLLRGNGSSLTTPTRIPVGSSAGPRPVVIGDADNDGDNDIIVGKSNWSEVAVLSWENNSFSVTTLPCGLLPNGVAVGDADNDGLNEIVTGNYGSWSTDGNSISVIDWSAGSTPTVVNYPSGFQAYDVAIGDADQDGDNDIVAGHQSNGRLSFYHWNGTSFDPEERLPEGRLTRDPTAVVMGDADGNGYVDIITMGYTTAHLLRWDGEGYQKELRLPVTNGGNDVAFGDANQDGQPDIVTANPVSMSVSLLQWDPDIARETSHGGIWVRSGASVARFAHVNMHFGAIVDDSPASTYADCFFDRTGGAYSLSATHGTNPILRCTVVGNDGGDGIRAGSRELIECVAEKNIGIGLQGGALTRCIARENGDEGMIGTSAVDCVANANSGTGIKTPGPASGSVAMGNGGWGIEADGGWWGVQTVGAVSNCTATANANGIKGRDLIECMATDNVGIGLQPSGTATGCIAINNGGAGLTGNSLTDCVVLGNGSGLVLSGTALRGYVAQNAGDPTITGGTLNSTSVLHNAGGGTSANVSVLNSWIVGNAGPGVVGRTTAAFTSIQSSDIRWNGGVGVRSAGPINGSVLLGNTNYDYEETRASSAVTTVDLTGNYWGTETTVFMDAHPFGPGTTGNVPAIFDIRDDLDLAQVNYGEHLASASLAGPNAEPPAFLLSASTDGADPLGAGVQEIILTYSEVMNTGAPLSVTFGQEAPYDTYIVEPSPGWQDATTWRGTFAVLARSAVGEQTLRVAGAVAVDGFAVPDDTAHTFLIDESGSGSANNGLVGAIGTTAAEVIWTENGRPTTAQGYNLLATPTEGLTQSQIETGLISTADLTRKVNAAPLATASVVDSGLTPGRYHIYAVNIVDGNNNATPWTDLFYGFLPPVQGNSVIVNVTPDFATWSFTDSASTIHTGTGDATRTGIPTGTVTMTWQPLAGFTAPAPNPEGKTLSQDATITFTGTYTPNVQADVWMMY